MSISKKQASAMQGRLAKSNGQSFETLLAWINTQYHATGRATIEKVDPPSKVVGGGGKPRIIYLDNPYLDYVGTWSERGGRMIVAEAKSTAIHRLALSDDRGLKRKQFDHMARWHAAGALTFLLWFHANDMKVINFETLRHALESGAKSLRWEDFAKMANGGRFRWDYLQELDQLGA